MDCSPSELALKRGLANHSHCHMYTDSLPDAHTQSQVISHHTHSYPPASQVSGNGSQSHTNTHTH